MTLSDYFFYLGFFGLPAYYAIEIAKFFHARHKHRKLIEDLEHQIALKGEGDLTDYARGFSFWVVGLHIVWAGLSIDDYGWIAYLPPLLGVAAQIVSRQNQALAPIIQTYEAMQIERQKQTHFSSNFEDIGEDEGSFDYQDSAFNGSGSSAGSSAKREAPRGFENRHPDDAKLWAHVDDPSNPPEVRESYFSKIMKREAERAGCPGREVIIRED